MIKKKIAVFLLILACILPLAAQTAKDVVLVVDTSITMLPYYDEVGKYITGPFLAENVSFNDTFHLISFGTKVRFEIARRVIDQGDIETIIGRVWLLYPVEPSSNAGAALSYAEQYIRSIPGGREKKIFFISDGNAKSLVSASSASLRPGAELFFIQASNRIAVERSNDGNQDDGRAGARNAAGSSGTGNSAGTGTGADSSGENPSVTPDIPPGPQDTASTPDEPPSSSTNGVDSGTTPVQAVVADPDTSTGSAAGETTGGTDFSFSAIPLPFLIGAGLLLLLILIFVIIMMARNLHSSPNKVMASVNSNDDTAARNAALLNSFASRQAEAALQGPQRRYHHVRDDSNQFLTNPPMLSLFVEEQNTAIGRRNVHALKKGSTFFVGGGKSDFLIFLVPVPSRIGQLHFDGNNCTFTPLKPKYFPDLGSTPVHECIGKTIRVLSDKNYEIFFHFERYKDPLIVLNQLLHSISVPEAPSLRS